MRKIKTNSKSDGTLDKPAAFQSQRDCVIQPRVARHEPHWVFVGMVFSPNGVVSRLSKPATTRLGLLACDAISQGSSCLATLGFVPEPLWDSTYEFPKVVFSKS